MFLGPGGWTLVYFYYFLVNRDRIIVTIPCVAAGLRCGLWPADSLARGSLVLWDFNSANACRQQCRNACNKWNDGPRPQRLASRVAILACVRHSPS